MVGLSQHGMRTGIHQRELNHNSTLCTYGPRTKSLQASFKSERKLAERSRLITSFSRYDLVGTQFTLLNSSCKCS